MKSEDIEKMWNIDSKAQLGEKLSNDEIEFFNKNYFLMLQEMKDNYDHWMHHTKKFNAT